MKVYCLLFFLLVGCGHSNSGTTVPITSNPGQSNDKDSPAILPPIRPQPQTTTTPPDSQPIHSNVENVDPKTKTITVRPGPTNVTPSDSAEIQLRSN